MNSRINRRQFLKFAGVALAGLSTIACENTFENSRSLGWIFGRPTTSQPLSHWVPQTIKEKKAQHLLNRLSYGPRPAEIKTLAEQIDKYGMASYIEAQLSPTSIDDTQANLLTRRIETLHYRSAELFDITAQQAIDDLRRSTLLRALYSERQLQELMVEFWSDHFNIYADKGDCARLKIVDDREVIRKHALGKFRDLLMASATSPAMLVYLDGELNIKGKPNENYARELMELHTLGVDGGYSQNDVMSAARALTGWHLKRFLHRGEVEFVAQQHDSNAKELITQSISVDNQNDLASVIDIVAQHPSTASFISKKLCRRFVSDNPDPSLINNVASTFQKSDGDIKETLKTLLLSDQFLNADRKFKRPYTFAISALRALAAVSDGGKALQQQLLKMGQMPFNWPTPDGYPDDHHHWQAALLPRWNFAFALTQNEIKGTSIALDNIEQNQTEQLSILSAATIQRMLTDDERENLAAFNDPSSLAAMMICMPDFQYY